MLTRQAHLKNLSPVYISAPGYVHVKFIQRLVTGRNMVTGENQLLGLIKPDCAVKNKKKKRKRRRTRTYSCSTAWSNVNSTAILRAVQEPAVRVPFLTHQHCTLVRSTLAHVYFQA